MNIETVEVVNARTTDRKKIKEPEKYKVVVYNDNVTTMEFVVALLITIFKHDTPSAVELTQRIHNEGKAIAGIYRFEIAEQKVAEAIDMSRSTGYPLVIKAMPE
jgi:ATP-dependent Clp protease adaptor protein ClpS